MLLMLRSLLTVAAMAPFCFCVFLHCEDILPYYVLTSELIFLLNFRVSEPALIFLQVYRLIPKLNSFCLFSNDVDTLIGDRYTRYTFGFKHIINTK